MLFFYNTFLFDFVFRYKITIFVEVSNNFALLF